MKTQSERRQPCEGREDANDQVEIVFGLHLIGLEYGTRFLDKSQSKVEQTRAIWNYFRHSDDNSTNFSSICRSFCCQFLELRTWFLRLARFKAI